MRKGNFFALLSILVIGATAMTEAKTSEKTMKATFAGGCFWCMQPPFEDLKGVISVKVGYTGGHKDHPTYEEVCTGTTGHAEAIEVTYDPAKVSYDQLLDTFWKNIDPTTENAQFADRGTQYRTAIFYHGGEQERLAEASKARLAKSGKFNSPIVTEIVPASTFWPAEDYHQQYYMKCPLRYKAYKYGSGRETFIEKLWGKTK
jgi:methionine-S-sulfoxide reductase